MALPKLETPKYELTVPSTGETVEYRPFLVKEERVLMMAQESNDNDQIIGALKTIIESCTFGKIKPNLLTTYDAEYIFLQLRAKSVGETVEFMLKCEECEYPMKIEIDLTEVQVTKGEEVSNKIMLNDEVGVTLKPITLGNSKSLMKDETDINAVLSAVIDTIFDDDGEYKSEETSQKELDEFINSLNHEQVQSIQKYITSLPVLEHTITWKCPKCGHKNEVTLRGLQDFFV